MWLLVPVARGLTLLSVLYFVTAAMVNRPLITICLMAAAMKSGPVAQA